MKINRFIGGLAGLVLVACGQENNTNNNSNGNNEIDGGYSDSGYVDGGRDVDGGQVSDGIEVYLETRNNTTNQPQTTFNYGEMIKFYTRAKDTKCSEFNSCNNPNGQNTQGIKYCTFTDNLGNTTTLSINSDGDNISQRTYSANNYSAKVSCVIRRDSSMVQSDTIEFNVQ